MIDTLAPEQKGKKKIEEDSSATKIKGQTDKIGYFIPCLIREVDTWENLHLRTSKFK